MNKILVCGSEGSLMQAVIPKLLAAGHIVIGVDNLMRHGKRPGFLTPDSYIFEQRDLVDKDHVFDIIYHYKPDYVIQAAAQIYGVGGFNAHCADILSGDLNLHANVLKASAEYGVKKVIYISSSMVYENCPQSMDIPVSEEMPDNYPPPQTEYGLSKFVGERLCRAYKKQYGLNYLIWRPFNIITPFEKAENEIGISHVFADYIDNIVIKKLNTLPILGSGEQIRCFTWIDEVATAIANYSFNDFVCNESYNLGNPEPITMKDLAKKIHRIAKEDFGFDLGDFLKFTTVKYFPNDVLVRIPSMEKTELHLGWKATVKIEDSIRKCLEII